MKKKPVIDKINAEIKNTKVNNKAESLNPFGKIWYQVVKRYKKGE